MMRATDEQADTEVSDISPAEGAAGFEARSIWLQIRLVFFKEGPDATGLMLIKSAHSDVPLGQGFGVRVSWTR